MSPSAEESKIAFSGEETIELTHDALAARVLERASPAARRMLQARRLIEEGLRQYRQRGQLLSRKDLRFLRPIMEELDLPPEAEVLIRKSRRRNWYLNIGLSAVAVLVVGLSLAWVIQRNATRVKARIAKANELAFPAGFEAENNQLRNALLLAGAAWRLTEEAPLPAAQQVLVDAFHRGRQKTPMLMQRLPLPATPNDIRYHPGTRRALVWYADSLVFLYHLAERRRDLLVTAFDGVTDITLSPRGNMALVSLFAGEGGEVRLFDVNTAPPRQAAALPWADLPVAMQFSEDGSRFFVAWRDSLALWDASAAAPTATLDSDVSLDEKMGFLTGGAIIAAIAADSSLRRWSAGGQALAPLYHPGAVRDWQELMPGFLVTIAGNRAFLWGPEGDTLAGIPLAFGPAAQPAEILGYHPADSTVYFNWTGGLLRWAPFRGTADTIFFEKQRLDLRYFPLAGQILDRTEGALYRVVQNRLERVINPISPLTIQGVRAGRDGDHFLLWYENQWELWRYDYYPFISVEGVSMFRVDEATGRLLIVTRAGQVLFSSDPEMRPQPLDFPAPIVRADFLGGAVIAMGRDGRLYRYSNDEVQPLGSLQGAGEWEYTIFTPEPRLLLRDAQNQYFLYDTAGQRQNASPINHGPGIEIFHFAYAPGRRLLATAGLADRRAVIWDLEGNKVADSLMHGLAVWDIDFSPDEQFLLTVSGDGFIRTWDLDGALRQRIKAHDSWILAAAFAPGGRDLLTVSRDRNARHWAVADSILPGGRLLTGHLDTVTGAAFAPGGAHYLTWDAAGLTLLRDSQDNLLGAFAEPDGSAVARAAFMAGSRRIVTRHDNGTLYLWLPPREIRQWLEENDQLMKFTEEEQRKWGIETQSLPRR